jgi:peptidoglycan/xylan/chitin deacetylase (PgdA/CDA1 family)
MRAIFYHGIMTEPWEYESYYAFNFVKARDFEAQANELARHWRVLSLLEIREHLSENRPFPPRAVHLSFDDGFKSSLIAAEILDRLRLPWTLFVIVDTVLDGHRPPFARVVEAATASHGRVRLDRDEIDLATSQGKLRLGRRAKALFATAEAEELERLVSELLATPGIVEPEAARFPFLSAEEVRELQASGVEIGNHTARHLNLTRCSRPTLHREVSESRLRLERALGAPVRSFSYPDGRHNRVARGEVSRAHDVAVATWTPRRPYRPLALRRIQAPPTVDRLRSVLEPENPTRFWWQREMWDLQRRRNELKVRMKDAWDVR